MDYSSDLEDDMDIVSEAVEYDDDGTVDDEDQDQEALNRQIQEDTIRTLEIENTALSGSQFWLVMKDSKNFRKFVSAIGKIVNDCTWTIIKKKKEGDFEGIRTTSLCEDHTCFAIADFACTVLKCQTPDMPGYKSSNNEFTVYMKAFLNTLKPIKPNCMVGIRSEKGDDNLIICGMNPINFCFSYSCKLKTIQKELDDWIIPAKEYEYHVTLETKELADIMSYAKESNAEFFTISIDEHTRNGQGSNVEIRKTIFQIEGEFCSQEHVFYSRAEWNHGTDGTDAPVNPVLLDTKSRVHMQLKTTVDNGQWPPNSEFQNVYRATFSAPRFHDFLRSIIEQPRVSLRMHEDLPMLMTIPLGGDGSKIDYFIVKKNQ